MLADSMKQVQDAERQAEDIIANAQEKAAQIVNDAKAAAKQRQSDAESAAAAEAKAALADAEQVGEKEKAQYTAQVSERLTADQQEAYAKADEAVQAILAGLI